MPPLPTSLSVVALVVAWLVVLVPMAARRREHVPDSDERSAGFRVLRRPSSRRKRRVLSRTAVAPEPDVDDPNAGVDSMDDQALWDDQDATKAPPASARRRRTAARVATADQDDSADVADLDDPVDADETLDARAGATVSDDEDEEAGEDFVDGDEESDEDLAEELFDVEDDLDDDLEDDEEEEFEADAIDEPQSGSTGEGAELAAPADRDDLAGARSADDYDDEADDEDEREDDQAPARTLSGRSRSEWQVPTGWDAADEWAAEHPDVAVAPTAGRGSDPGLSGDPGRPAPTRVGVVTPPPGAAVGTGSDGHADDGRDEAAFRPVPRRSGRGGFDPESAAKAKAYRYRRRRRVAVVLLLATVALVLVSVFLVPQAWIAAAVCALLLALYLTYLRRQVRIEESIRQRRAARLAQARQTRPDYHREGAPAGSRTHGAPAVVADAAGVTVPPAQFGTGTPVDPDDDDPAFAELEYYRPLTYRRASGQ
jgi:hypothetical protein